MYIVIKLAFVSFCMQAIHFGLHFSGRIENSLSFQLLVKNCILIIYLFCYFSIIIHVYDLECMR